MAIWTLFWGIVAAGAAGGLVNAVISDNGFPLPRKQEGILRPGFISNVIVGASAAFVSWGLYGPYANAALIGEVRTNSEQEFFLTLSALTGSFLVGIGGSRFVTSEVDKKLLTLSATKAVLSPAQPGAAGAIARRHRERRSR